MLPAKRLQAASPQRERLELLMRVGRQITRDRHRGLFFQSGSSPVSSREPLSGSSPAGNRAVLSVIHYRRRRYVLTVAASEQGVSEGQEVNLTPSIISPSLLGLAYPPRKARAIIFISVTGF